MSSESRWHTSEHRSELPPNWSAIRRAVLERDKHRCRWMTKDGPCRAPATDVDHIRRGEDHALGNLRGLCGYHHAWKTARESAAERARARAKLLSPDHPGSRGKHPGLK